MFGIEISPIGLDGKTVIRIITEYVVQRKNIHRFSEAIGCEQVLLLIN